MQNKNIAVENIEEARSSVWSCWRNAVKDTKEEKPTEPKPETENQVQDLPATDTPVETPTESEGQTQADTEAQPEAETQPEAQAQAEPQEGEGEA